MSGRAKLEEVKQVVVDPKANITYHRGSFLGKGGFARCYEFKNTQTKEIFAGKVVSKTMLKKPHHKQKMCQEIEIHSSMSHKYIVSSHSYFEDENNMYIILELCRKRSLMEMHRRRKTLTVPEVRYFMRQIVLACKYMHENKVIHRDLKLGNLFINDEMEIKVGDFGLATRINHDGERKETLCGTPNYIAPEILTKSGHSFEVDMWSLGCIMYTLLVGTPPFETKDIQNTYSKIKKCDYYLPPKLDRNARNLIEKLLNSDPKKRPNADVVLEDDFLTTGYIPSRLPTSCLTMPPRFSRNMSLFEVSRIRDHQPLRDNIPIAGDLKNEMYHIPEIEIADEKLKENFQQASPPKDYYLGDLLRMLESVIDSKPEARYLKHGNLEDAQDPSAIPFVWISKWVDYTDIYGIGYQFCDNSVGVLFNDASHLILLQDGKNLQYIERDNKEHYYTIENYPSEMNKKITLLHYFNDYMIANLMKAGENARVREGDEMALVPHLRAWFRSKSAIVFHLSNGTYQANFFKDHTKIILCPVMGAVSLIDEDRNFTVYTFQLIEKYGCSPMLASRLRSSKSMVAKLYKDCQSAATALPQR